MFDRASGTGGSFLGSFVLVHGIARRPRPLAVPPFPVIGVAAPRVIVWSVGRLLYPLGRLAGAMRLASGGLCQLGAF